MLDAVNSVNKSPRIIAHLLVHLQQTTTTHVTRCRPYKTRPCKQKCSPPQYDHGSDNHLTQHFLLHILLVVCARELSWRPAQRARGAARRAQRVQAVITEKALTT